MGVDIGGAIVGVAANGLGFAITIAHPVAAVVALACIIFGWF